MNPWELAVLLSFSALGGLGIYWDWKRRRQERGRCVTEQEAEKVVQSVLDEVVDGWTAECGNYTEAQWRFVKGAEVFRAHIRRTWVDNGERHQIRMMIKAAFTGRRDV